MSDVTRILSQIEQGDPSATGRLLPLVYEQLRRHELEEAESLVPALADDLLALDEALDNLAAQDSTKAELVKLRYFAGLTGEQAAQALGISTSTADRYWAYARAWLHQEIVGADARSDGPDSENS